MWLPPALFLLSLPGCFSLQGPESVSGSEEGSVTVQCHYDTGWETHRKWWCQGKIWNFCKILIQSRGSEQEVKKDRMSIRDNHRNRSFTVTMEKLSREDADTYWCGIEKKGSDLGVQVKVTVGPAKTVLTTPTNLSSKPLAMSSTFYVSVASQGTWATVNLSQDPTSVASQGTWTIVNLSQDPTTVASQGTLTTVNLSQRPTRMAFQGTWATVSFSQDPTIVASQGTWTTVTFSQDQQLKYCWAFRESFLGD